MIVCLVCNGIFSYFYFRSNVTHDKFELQEILRLIVPLKENIKCSEIVRDRAKRSDSLVRNDGQYLGIFNQCLATVEIELVKLAIASPDFTTSFQEAYTHLQADRKLKSSITRTLRKSVLF